MKRLAAAMLLVLFLAPSAHALFSMGDVDDEFYYRKLKVSGSYVAVEIENKTDERKHFQARLFFLNFRGDVLATAYILPGWIGPKGKRAYRAYCHHNSGLGARDADEIEWQRF